MSICLYSTTLADELVLPAQYPKDYLWLYYSQNTPTSHSTDELQAHLDTFGISYQHRLKHPWIVSVGYRPQSFISKRQNTPTKLLTFFNSTQRIFRLYHPVYFTVGTEILYLVPVQKLNPPMTKDRYFATEIGIGIQSSLWYHFSEQYLLAFDLQRWRGTKTNQLHAWSLSLGIGYAY